MPDFLGGLESRLNEIATNVSHVQAPGDHMKGSGPEAYLAVGRSAMRNVLISCAAANLENVRSVLDFGSGAGRVARWLRAAFPEAKLIVSDVRKPFVEFCAKTFSAVPHLSSADFAAVEFPGTYDLIWSGSLVAHLSENQATAALDLMYRNLNKNGVMVVTTHGRKAINNQLGAQAKYIDDQKFALIAAQARSAGYGFAPHREGGTGGISISTLGWFESWCARSSERRIVHFAEKGWINHQDVVAIAKSPI